MIAFCYLLHIGEYTMKEASNHLKQTEEFKMGDITFFAKDIQGNFWYLPHYAKLDLITLADSAVVGCKHVLRMCVW